MNIQFVPIGFVPGKAPGRQRKYSDVEIRFIRENWEQMSDDEMAEQLCRPKGSVRHIRKKLGLRHFDRVEWTESEEQLLRKLYPDTPTKEIIKRIPRHNKQSIYQKARRLGLNKKEEYLLEVNRRLGKKLAKSEAAVKNRFSKGHRPINKGLKQHEYMSQESIERTKDTRFKKGNIPPNTKWNGAISCRVDSDGNPYMYIRIEKASWGLLHRYNWEKENGPIPEGHILRCKNGNTTDCRPENWELITRKENAARNVNREKAAAALKRYYEEHGHPARDLHDSYVAGQIAGGNKELREYIIENRQDLIKIARKNYLLRRNIMEAEDE